MRKAREIGGVIPNVITRSQLVSALKNAESRVLFKNILRSIGTIEITILGVSNIGKLEKISR